MENLDGPWFYGQAHGDYSPVGWHLGHIGFTEALWILEHLAGKKNVISPAQRRLFAADSLPKAQRQQLPSPSTIQGDLAAVRSQVLDYFDHLSPAQWQQQQRLWWWLLQHESQHNETMGFLLQIHRFHSQTLPPAPKDNGPAPKDLGTMVTIPAGPVILGSDRPEAMDNERPPHTIHVEDYAIDRYPVTWGEYEEFMAIGGYTQPQWWSEAGWHWREQHHITKPRYWRSESAWATHPVHGVSYYEAEAYARFKGKRLPTEAEWEKAARGGDRHHDYPWGNEAPTPHHGNFNHHVGHTTPVNHYSQGQTPQGLYDLFGNVWEWTASWFQGYDGFSAFPYGGYSQAYFDQHHRVMRGGSWVTRPWPLRNSFRNWYHPWVREIFVGFRCARSLTAESSPTVNNG